MDKKQSKHGCAARIKTATASILFAATLAAGITACTGDLDDGITTAQEGDVLITGLNISVATTDDTDDAGAARNTDNNGGGGAATRADDGYGADGYGIYDWDNGNISPLPATASLVRTNADIATAGSIVEIYFENKVSGNWLFEGFAESNGDGTWTLYEGYGRDVTPISGGIVLSKADIADGINIYIYNSEERNYCFKPINGNNARTIADVFEACATLTAGGIDGANGYGTITATNNGNGTTLDVEMIHQNGFVTLTIDNQTGDPAKESGITNIKLVCDADATSSGTKKDGRPMHAYDADGDGTIDTWQTTLYDINGTTVTYNSLKLTYTDGTTKSIAIPAGSQTLQTGYIPNGSDGTGSQTLHYDYTLTLKAGVPDEVTLRTDNTLPGWTEGNVGGDVIRIYNATQLALIGNDPKYPLDGEYVLMNDIDMTAAKKAADVNEPGGWEGNPWRPIGKYSEEYMADDNDGYTLASGYSFTGTFNGNGYTIRNLKINQPTNLINVVSYNGLFTYIGSEGIVHNLHLADVDIDVTSSVGTNYTGGITGGIDKGRIDLCSVTSGTISGENSQSTYVGGIVGYCSNRSEIISRCHTNGTTVNSTGNDISIYAGGITGYNVGIVVACYTLGGSVNANAGSGTEANAGGIVGQGSSTSTIFGCYAKGANAYARTDADTKDYPGTLVGDSWSKISSCYSTLGTGTAPTGFADTDKASGSIGNNSDSNIKYSVGIKGYGYDGTNTFDATTFDGTANTDGYKVLTTGTDEGEGYISLAPITANNDGSLTVGTAVQWTAGGIWGAPTGWANATVAPVIDLGYNGEPGS